MSDDNTSPKTKNIKTTPPTNRKVRNPFDKALIGRLHKPICSPGMCKIYKKQTTGLFRWDIDQACALVPADITPCSSQYEPSPDPALERIAEEATEKFFSQEMVMPSPLESSKKVKPLQTSYDSILKISSVREETIVMRDVSAQTVLTLPPELPPELEKMLQQFCTFTQVSNRLEAAQTSTQDQDVSGDYEITANGSLRRKLLFEEHSDLEPYAESTDDEIHVEKRPSSLLEHHTPIVFSPDLSNSLSKGMKRTFGTPQSKHPGKLRNKILQVEDFGEPCFSPIQFPSTAELSLASTSISPLTKPSSDEEGDSMLNIGSSNNVTFQPMPRAATSTGDSMLNMGSSNYVTYKPMPRAATSTKNDFTSPESEAMATCLDCIASDPESERESKRPCFCKTPDRSILRRSKSLKEGASPPRSRKSSYSDKRSLSMSSLHRSRSVQKLDFSMDMSLDGSQADLEPSHPEDEDQSWSMIDTASIHKLLQMEPLHKPQDTPSSTKIHIEVTKFTETPVKGKYTAVTSVPESMHMSLDASLESENPLSLENKKVDFNAVDLKYLTENSQFDERFMNATKAVDSSSFKRVDSGFNENTFYANASSYYESAIKPSELIVTNVSNKSGQALKEISNVNWMRVDSGFKDETSDNIQFYEGSKGSTMRYSEAKLEDKENDIDRFFLQTAKKNEAMSMSDIFNDEVTFNCNFSSTPSKNKTRQLNS